jgi:hypothetical protein
LGPFSDERQVKRAEAICRVLAQDLTEDARRIWEQHLRGLSRSEEQYNARVKMIWTGIRNKQTGGWL